MIICHPSLYLQQTSSQKMKNNKNAYICEEEDFDTSVWRKAQIKNNSGYLDEEYQTTQEFPLISDYHFRIEDDHKILQLEKLTLNDQSLNLLTFQQGSDKFKNRLKGLIQSIDNVKMDTQSPTPQPQAQRHGFYSLQGYQYDQQAAIKQAFSRIEMKEVQTKIQSLSLNQNKPKFIKKPKPQPKSQTQSAAPQQSIGHLSKQLKKLTINQEQM